MRRTLKVPKEELSDKVQVMLSRMRLQGLGLCTLAVVTQIPWCFAIYHFAYKGVGTAELTMR